MMKGLKGAAVRWRSRLVLTGLLALAACAGVSDHDPETTRPALSGAEQCERHASPVNPLAARPSSSVLEHARLPGGMGGTGAPTPPLAQEGGIGGTGIVGVVTGFASICVNGVKVEYTPHTPLLRDGVAAPLSVLAVGQVVAMQASGEGDRLQARRIAVLDAVVGPLGLADAASGRFEVMGQAATALVPADLAGLRSGDWVRVSGHRLGDGEIRASRVQRADAGVARLVGLLSPDEGGGWRVAGTRVDLGRVLWPQGLQAGQEVSVAGDWTGARLQVTALQAQPTRAALGPVRQLLLQGYVHDWRGGAVSLGGEPLRLASGLEVRGGTVDSLSTGQAVLLRARLDPRQQLVVDRVEFRQEGPGQRGPVVRQGGDERGASPAGRHAPGAPGAPGAQGTVGRASGASGNPGVGLGGGQGGGQGRGRGNGRGGD